ncbi:hypothetical protein [Photobacterium kishitanii]|uniref:Uncharacterized protein n=1 Tax=Photobacterium kishitanii TaxID=318456 RepID=A0A2T3KKT6_9GAMM|nr:hypothetical protein [Photobacterium kishitanii]PSV00322.1 hypothetical protein C9J27_04140 [Photobacterium kishitanii]
MTINHLREAYLGELYGINFFSTLLNGYEDRSHVDKLDALLRIEHITGKKLKAALEPLGVVCPQYDPKMEQKGIADANKWIHLPWNELIDTMVTWVAPYQQRYQELADSAQDHHELFKLVAEHENTIYKFLLAERFKLPKSIHILHSFILMHTIE